ncbi:Zn(II)2Cys6 transcription factor domain-containing protein [Aspergillus clavatus NRRL 1]|uniref:C6 zinc finger domain protein n=1 Tax=Aspergillus clavatus (strain ATCC 1007 / CBS 513.65 / DSM 816 / NCTC 3887 / NRRL 1 / QM 1276 / 107) TaxID=344612 RepID=A1CKG0_ASPCL|nr:C6 zinc finger domain protein [Aspergillus clavatus NRRL 1]EAW09634.1 C6 zinc finger domain protein [Aspergillus clavatus NRRL 1]
MLAESGTPSSTGGDTPKLRAACENCRQSKVKCNLSGKSTCIRCLRHGLACRYRLANRSGKPKGSKNRATLRKLRQFPDQRPALRALKGKDDLVAVVDNHYHSEYSEARVLQRDETGSPSSQDTSPPAEGSPEGPVLAYSSIQETVPPAGSEYLQASMSPTFLQKEFITKGLTSCPLAVHIPGAMQPTCDCRGTLAFHENQLRDMVSNSMPLRFDQSLQSVKVALSVCLGFVQCSICAKDSTSLLLPVSTLDLVLQLLDYCITYGLATPHSVGEDSKTSRYGLYEVCPAESWWIRRFLIRGRLVQCKEVLAGLQEAIDICLGSPFGALGNGTLEGGQGDSCLEQIVRGYEATVEAFLHCLSGNGCICT